VSAYQGYQILRRNGAVVSFEPNKIAVALMKAFLAVHGTQGAASASVRETVDGLTESVVRALAALAPGGGTFHIEDAGPGRARPDARRPPRGRPAYVLYRERRAQERQAGPVVAKAEPVLMVTDRGNRVPLDAARLQTLIETSCAGLGADVRPDPILAETKRNLYDGVPIDEVHKAAILAARTLIEKDPATPAPPRGCCCTPSGARSSARSWLHSDMHGRYADYFPQFVKKGVQAELLDEKLLQYDLAKLGAALKADRDLQFDYPRPADPVRPLFPAHRRSPTELPQAFFMRVAMGLALNEIDREARAIEFYEVLFELRLRARRRPCSTPAPALRSLELLSHYRFRRPRRHLRGALKEKRAALQVRRRPGQRLTNVRARQLHQGHQRQELWAWCPSLKVSTTPRSRSTRAARGRAPSALTSRAGTSTSRSSSSCARTPATTGGAPIT
jgi:ribonucleoside-diphosphate reductase alpha chain